MHLSLVRGSRIGAFALSVLVAATAVVALAGWAVSRPGMTGLGLAGTPMNPATAVCLLLLGAALLVPLPPTRGSIEWRGLADRRGRQPESAP